MGRRIFNLFIVIYILVSLFILYRVNIELNAKPLPYKDSVGILGVYFIWLFGGLVGVYYIKFLYDAKRYKKNKENNMPNQSKGDK